MYALLGCGGVGTGVSAGSIDNILYIIINSKHMSRKIDEQVWLGTGLQVIRSAEPQGIHEGARRAGR
jgi:hypothetical protein